VANSPSDLNLVRRNFELDVRRKTRPFVVGIDPGLNGAVSLVDCDTLDIIDCFDLPTFKKPSKARKQGYLEFVDAHALSSLLDLYAPHVSLAVLEEPGAMPGQGLSSTFRFGHICGQIHGVLAGHYVATVPVKPGVWKSALALSADKEDSRRLASKIFPNHSSLWPLKKHNDRAESALLAYYGIKYLSKFIDLSRR
jgi:crossover junction endodeoxyribonuclease RuvC